MQSSAPVRGFGQRVGESLRAFRSVYGNPGLRLLQGVWAASILGGYAYVVALAVFAYHAHGPYAVGALAVARWLSAGIAAPAAGVIGDRYRRVSVMAVSNGLRGAAMVLIAVAIVTGISPFVVYALAVFAALSGVATIPAQAALTPALARTPEELTAANVSTSTITTVGAFAGPALSGFLLAVSSPEAAFLMTGALLLLPAVAVLRIPEEGRSRERVTTGVAGGGLEGARTLAGDPRLRLVVGLLGASMVAKGALDVFVVVLAIETLDFGEAGVGFLNAAAGVGGLAGVFVTAGLVGRRQLASPVGIGLALWGVPLALIGLVPSKASALLLLSAVGAAATLLAVAGNTLLQRAAPEAVLARVFGIFNAVQLGALAVGSAIAPLLVDLVGVRAGLLAVGTLLPVLAVASWRRLRAIDDAALVPEEPLRLLQGHPVFAPLEAPALERLATRLKRRRVAAGTVVFEQGDPGEDFYLVADGVVRASVDGVPAAELGPGEGFGEIALLRDVPRTATIESVAETTLYVLGRAEFLATVTGHAESAAAAEQVAGSRLAAYRPAAV